MTLQVQVEQDYAGRALGEIATSLPGSTAIFRRHKLDFCCGGKVQLAEAAKAKGLAVEALVAELGALASASVRSPAPAETGALIDLIETRYHAVHRAELPELIRLARRVEAVHKDKPAVPRGLADLLEHVHRELDAHMQKEEMVLFPLMRAGGSPMIGGPISVMLSEHLDHGENLRKLDELTNGFEPPEEACNTWRALYSGVHKFVDDVMEHIHTENNILFPRFAG